MTPLAAEADDIQRWEVEACGDAELAEKSFDELSERAQRDQEEAERVRKERAELLQQDAKTRQGIIDLLAKAKREQDLRLVVERSAALEQRAKLDADTVT